MINIEIKLNILNYEMKNENYTSFMTGSYSFIFFMWYIYNYGVKAQQIENCPPFDCLSNTPLIIVDLLIKLNSLFSFFYFIICRNNNGQNIKGPKIRLDPAVPIYFQLEICNLTLTSIGIRIGFFVYGHSWINDGIALFRTHRIQIHNHKQ